MLTIIANRNQHFVRSAAQQAWAAGLVLIGALLITTQFSATQLSAQIIPRRPMSNQERYAEQMRMSQLQHAQQQQSQMQRAQVQQISAQGYPNPNPYAAPPMQPQIGFPQQRMAYPQTQTASQSLLQTQYSDERGKKPHDPRIAGMPDVTEEMDVIHHRSQLVIARHNIVRTAIADPTVIDIVQYSPNEISIIGLALGSTTLTLWFDSSADPLIYLVTTIPDPGIEDRRRLDLGKLEKKLAILFPNSKVYLIPMRYKLLVKGQARDSQEATQILSIIRAEYGRNYGANGAGGAPTINAAGGGLVGGGGNFGSNGNNSNIVNMLQVPGEHQVMLHVRIAELNRSMLRRLGVDLNFLINGGRQTLMSSAGGIPTALTGIFENGEISVLVNWLASNGTAKILAEPSLTVLSGHAASFLSGGEFAVPTIIGVGGAQGQQTSFRGFGTSLFVTPTIFDRDLIRMRIRPEFSAINSGNSSGGIPGLDSRRVSTTVQLREGQTIAIAGLLSHSTSTEVTRIPFLGELPIVGPALFNAKESTQGESELLILVTPEIVRPMEPEEVPPVPGFNVTMPNDNELYEYAMTEGAPDNGVYQLPPYGYGTGTGIDVGYAQHNPVPSAPPGGSPYPSPTLGGFAAQPGGYLGQPATGGYPGQPATGGYPGQGMPQYAPGAGQYPAGPMPNRQPNRGFAPPAGQNPGYPAPRSNYQTPAQGREPSVRHNSSRYPPYSARTAQLQPANERSGFRWPWTKPAVDESQNVVPSDYVYQNRGAPNQVQQTKYQRKRR